jgi:hypothetical protein
VYTSPRQITSHDIPTQAADIGCRSDALLGCSNACSNACCVCMDHDQPVRQRHGFLDLMITSRQELIAIRCTCPSACSPRTSLMPQNCSRTVALHWCAISCAFCSRFRVARRTSPAARRCGPNALTPAAGAKDRTALKRNKHILNQNSAATPRIASDPRRCRTTQARSGSLLRRNLRCLRCVHARFRARRVCKRLYTSHGTASAN